MTLVSHKITRIGLRKNPLPRTWQVHQYTGYHTRDNPMTIGQSRLPLKFKLFSKTLWQQLSSSLDRKRTRYRAPIELPSRGTFLPAARDMYVSGAKF